MSLLTKSWINWHLFLHKICPNYFFRFHSSLSYRYLYLRSANGPCRELPITQPPRWSQVRENARTIPLWAHCLQDCILYTYTSILRLGFLQKLFSKCKYKSQHLHL